MEGGTNDSELSDAELSLPNLPFTSQTVSLFVPPMQISLGMGQGATGPMHNALTRAPSPLSVGSSGLPLERETGLDWVLFC